jgi:hypothetical protein
MTEIRYAQNLVFERESLWKTASYETYTLIDETILMKRVSETHGVNVHVGSIWLTTG